MSKWKYTLYIKDEFKKAKETESKEDNIILLKKIISELKRIFNTNKDVEIEIFIDQFNEIKDYLEADVYDDIKEFQSTFNVVFDDLYDWADISLDRKFGGWKNCWIETL